MLNVCNCFRLEGHRILKPLRNAYLPTKSLARKRPSRKENDYCTQYPLIRLPRDEIGNADLRFADDRDNLQPRQVLLCQRGQVIAQVDRRCIDRARCNQFEQHKVFADCNFILGQSQPGQGP